MSKQINFLLVFSLGFITCYMIILNTNIFINKQMTSKPEQHSKISAPTTNKTTILSPAQLETIKSTILLASKNNCDNTPTSNAQKDTLNKGSFNSNTTTDLAELLDQLNNHTLLENNNINDLIKTNNMQQLSNEEKYTLISKVIEKLNNGELTEDQVFGY